MKRFLQALILMFVLGGMTNLAIAQDCSELFFSKYVEGTVNNRALEIYNPTADAIDLAGYAIARYSNGATDAPGNYTVELPSVMLEPYSTFVIVVDKRDVTGVCLDYPTWYGHLDIQALTDPDTGEVILDEDGNPIEGPVYEAVDECGGSFYAVHSEADYPYNAEYDLVGKAGFYCSPIYDENRMMYFNGNDAVALIKGAAAAADYSNIVDLVGVIGDNPEEDEFEGIDGWVNIVTYEDGAMDTFAVTRDRTLIRGAEVKSGDVKVLANGDSFDASEWISLPKNVFDVLGSHECDCDENTGLKDKVATTDIQIYPNPVTGNLATIEVKEAVAGISIHSVNGQAMDVSIVAEVADIIQLDVANLQAGLYMVKIKLESGTTVVEKLTISK